MVIKMNIWKTTTICIIVGFILDMILGDPYWLPHPIRLIGREITVLEQFLYRKTEEKKGLLIRGGILAVIVMVSTVLTSGVILFFSYHIHEFVGMAVESIMCYQVLAAKCLKVESMKVYQALAAKDTQAARKAVSMIVGRDTAVLDENGITKAAVETVAENMSDGVIAPLFYVGIGGAPLAFLYKAVNTMDSMFGYKNDKYIEFGYFPAKLDDVFNYIPVDYTSLTTGEKFLTGKQEFQMRKNPKCPEPPFEFAYAYGITCHKAQGSEWGKVMVYEEGFPYEKTEHARWAYTAATRASEKLVWVRP